LSDAAISFAVLFVELGQEVHVTGGSFNDALNEGAFLHKLLENLFKEQNYFESFDDM
jgi:tartrate dehydratase alpha subunit/fumarate hydratase class I-like protein